MADATAEDSRPIRGTDDLLAIFQAAEKPPSAFRIGAESEKFGVHAETGAPLAYDGPFGVVRIFEALIERGFVPEREVEGGPIVALRRGRTSITLEPGAQFELSGAPLPDLHAVRAELEAHFAELAPISERMNIAWLGVGFHPLARQEDLPWVPKQRYAVMREYLPPLGSGALDMMRRTATVQVNLDFSSEADAMRKLVLALRLSPIVHAMTANAPFVERRLAGKKSLRGDVWLRMDPARSGLVERVLRARAPRYLDYVEWALDAGMFLIKRNGQVLANTGQTFRDFLANGYRGERATVADYKVHLNTLFPEVRLKNTLEVRGCDTLPLELAPSVPALFTGILYDERALEQAEALVAPLSFDVIQAARPELVTRGLEARIGDRSVRALAESLLEIAAGGLDRRARRDEKGRTERVHLEPLAARVLRGRTPADELLAGLEGTGPYSVQELIRRTRAIPV